MNSGRTWLTSPAVPGKPSPSGSIVCRREAAMLPADLGVAACSRDVVITDLADENHALRFRLREAEADTQAYREVAQQAVHEVARLARSLSRQGETIRRQHETIQRLTSIVCDESDQPEVAP
jgi:hypothetical protein